MRLDRFLVVAAGCSVAAACGSETSTFAERDAGGVDAGSMDANVFGDGSVGPTVDATTAPLGDVEAVVTTDNAFGFGYGNDTTIASYVPGGPASHGSEIFDCPVGYGPHVYVVPSKDAPAGAFLYIVAWADVDTTQGVLAQFKRAGGAPLYSGTTSWQVCATGKFFDAANGQSPDLATANTYIGECNEGATGDTYSKGWVNTEGAITSGAIGKLAIGETNESSGGAFPIVCQVDDAGVKGIDPAANWMWFDPLDGTSPFVGNAGNRTKSFLLFRLPAAALTVK